MWHAPTTPKRRRCAKPARPLEFTARTAVAPNLSGPKHASGRVKSGEVSEWLKEHAWKVCRRLNPASGVRIPLSPPDMRSAPSWGVFHVCGKMAEENPRGVRLIRPERIRTAAGCPQGAGHGWPASIPRFPISPATPLIRQGLIASLVARSTHATASRVPFARRCIRMPRHAFHAAD